MKVTYQTCCGVDVHKSFLVATIIKTSGVAGPNYQKKRFFDFTSNETIQPHAMPYFEFEVVISSVTFKEIINPDYTIKIQDIPEEGDELTLKRVSFSLIKCKEDFYQQNPDFWQKKVNATNNKIDLAKKTLEFLAGSV